MNSVLRIIFIAICYLVFCENIVDAITVECEYIVWRSEYTCKLAAQNISGHENVTHVNGNHDPGHTNEDVKRIDFQRMKFDRMPKDFNKFFTNVERIYLSDTGLKKIFKEDLENFSKLLQLYAYDNELESLDSNLFERNPNLEWLDLSKNKLESIGADLLKPLTKLGRAYFEYNPCIVKNAETKSEVEALRQEFIATCSPKPETMQHEYLLGQIELLKAKNSRLKAEIAGKRTLRFFF